MNILIKLSRRFRELLEVSGRCLFDGSDPRPVPMWSAATWDTPSWGSVELVVFMATLTAARPCPTPMKPRARRAVELLVRLLSARTQAIIELCTHAVSLLLFAVVTWRMALYVQRFSGPAKFSMNLEFPMHSIIFLTAFCFLVLTLTILEDVKTLSNG